MSKSNNDLLELVDTFPALDSETFIKIKGEIKFTEEMFYFHKNRTNLNAC